MRLLRLTTWVVNRRSKRSIDVGLNGSKSDHFDLSLTYCVVNAKSATTLLSASQPTS